MQATKATLHEIFNSYYKIPSYQRLYSWKEENWEELLSDFSEAYTKNYETNQGYFLGSLIIKIDSHEANTSDVIDGQQRLTTISLLLKVIADILSEENPDDFDSKTIIKKFLKEEIKQNVYKNKLNHIKLGSNEGIDAINYKVCMDSSYEEIRKKIDDVLEDKKEVSNILKCYLYFYKALKGISIEYKKYKQKYKIIEKSIDGYSKIDIIKLKDFIISHVLLVRITLDSNEDQQEIFNTMNSTGLKLKTGDLLKNYFFSDENLSNKYLKSWQEIFESSNEKISFWTNELDKVLYFIKLYHETQNSDFNTYNQKTNYKNLFKLYEDDKDNKEIYINEILDISNYYFNLFYSNYQELDYNNDENLTFFAINRVRFDGTLLLIMFFLQLNKNISDSHKQQIYLLTLQITFIWSIFSLASNKLAKFVAKLFFELHKNIDDGIKYYNDFIKDNVKEYDFEALISTDFDINKLKYRNTVVFILSLLENIIREKEILFKYTDETIEHIVPRTDWVNKGYKISNERLINYLGNLTFLSKTGNPSAGNNSFVDKKSTYKKSPYLITQNLRDYDSFDEAELLARNKILYDELNKKLQFTKFLSSD
jgi:hypothetical protein